MLSGALCCSLHKRILNYFFIRTMSSSRGRRRLEDKVAIVTASTEGWVKLYGCLADLAINSSSCFPQYRVEHS